MVHAHLHVSLSGFGFGVSCFGFRVWGFGLRVQGLGLRVSVVEFSVRGRTRTSGPRCDAFGFRAKGEVCGGDKGGDVGETKGRHRK